MTTENRVVSGTSDPSNSAAPDLVALLVEQNRQTHEQHRQMLEVLGRLAETLASAVTALVTAAATSQRLSLARGRHAGRHGSSHGRGDGRHISSRIVTDRHAPGALAPASASDLGSGSHSSHDLDSYTKIRSSLSGSLSREAVTPAVTDRHTAEVTVQPLPARGPSDDGEFGMAVQGWSEGVQEVTGRPLTRPTRQEVITLIETLRAHRKEAEPIGWMRTKGAAFARTAPSRLNAFAFKDWIDNGEQPARARSRPDSELSAPKDDLVKRRAEDARQRRLDDEHRQAMRKAGPVPVDELMAALRPKRAAGS
jgi:hypothetical protein